MTRLLSLTAMALVLLVCSTASAHYLWLNVDSKAGDNGTVNLYFEGGPGPGDGKYLDPFVKEGVTWVRTAKDNTPKVIELSVVEKPGKRWLASPLEVAGPRSLDSYGKWGVYRYGETDVLLHYYAQHLDVDSAGDFAALGRAEKLALDIVPKLTDKALEVQVLWKGKPAAERTVKIRGPKGFKENVKTDKDGKVSVADAAGGFYTFLTSVEEKDLSGTDNGKTYEMVRHNATLTLTLPKSE